MTTTAVPYEVIDGWPYVYGRPLFGGDDRTLVDVVIGMARQDDVNLVVTPNVDQLLLGRSNPEIESIFSSASLLLADGAPLVGLARILGVDPPPRHTGADLLPLISAVAPARAIRIVVLGGRDGVSETAVENLRRLHPGADITAVPMPYFATDSAPDESVIRTLHALRPDVVFVCLGFPKQEQWVLRSRPMLPPAVYIGAGAAVDFAAGAARRAPALVQRLGFEWLWRLAREPRRLAHRYLVRGPSFLAVAWDAHRRHRSSVREAA